MLRKVSSSSLILKVVDDILGSHVLVFIEWNLLLCSSLFRASKMKRTNFYLLCLSKTYLCRHRMFSFEGSLGALPFSF